jgi:hypothetical protein
MRTTASLISLMVNIEAGQIAINGKACGLEPIGHGSGRGLFGEFARLMPLKY